MFQGQGEICVLKFSNVLLLTTSCSKLFQSTVVLGKKEYQQPAVFDGTTL